MSRQILGGEGLTVIQVQLGEWDNLNHLLVCEKTGEACIVDPFSGNYWLSYCERKDWKLKSAVLTHSHWDHSKGVPSLYEAGVEIWVHELEAERGWQGPDSQRWNNAPNTSTVFKLGLMSFDVHCTPGHTPGHVTLIGNGLVISGDCLFLGRCGRTDLFGGDLETQHRSLIYLKSILEKLPQEWLVLPGHQYALADGSIPTFTTVAELLHGNEALNAAGDDEAFRALDFLSFDDSMAEKARRQRARASVKR